jgi:hypothetical protein
LVDSFDFLVEDWLLDALRLVEARPRPPCVALAARALFFVIGGPVKKARQKGRRTRSAPRGHATQRGNGKRSGAVAGGALRTVSAAVLSSLRFSRCYVPRGGPSTAFSEATRGQSLPARTARASKISGPWHAETPRPRAGIEGLSSLTGARAAGGQGGTPRPARGPCNAALCRGSASPEMLSGSPVQWPTPFCP